MHEGGVSNDSPFFLDLVSPLHHRNDIIAVSYWTYGPCDDKYFLVPLTASFRIYEEKNLVSHENAMLRLLYLLVVRSYCLFGSRLLFEHATEIRGRRPVRRGQRPVLQGTGWGHG